MEEDEMSIWQPHNALAPSFSGVGRRTLNEDPSNVLAEQLAMDHCKKGFDVVEEMAETEMLVTSCGDMLPGTPDGGFRDSDGLLRLVQVVRVPLLPSMDADEVAETLYHTVLTKIVKSQAWMRQTGILPHDFMIFCWVPTVGAYEVCLEQCDGLLWTEALMWNVQSGGWPFSLRMEVPTDPGGIFPSHFGQRSRERKSCLDGLCYFLNMNDFETECDDDEAMEWYLFDQDFEESTEDAIVDDAVVNCIASNIQTLIALAIQTIEHAQEMQSGINVAPSLMIFLFGCGKGNGWNTPQFFRQCSLHMEPTDSGYRGVGAREMPSGPPLLEGLSWWDLASDSAKDGGAPMPNRMMRTAAIDARNHASEKVFAVKDKVLAFKEKVLAFKDLMLTFVPTLRRLYRRHVILHPQSCRQIWRLRSDRQMLVGSCDTTLRSSSCAPTQRETASLKHEHLHLWATF